MNDELDIETTTLAEAREWLIERMYDEDVDCPCCTQRVKVYRRSIHSAEANSLIEVYRTRGTEWVHVPTFSDAARVGGSWAMLRRWGLIEENTEPRKDGGRAGYWRVTGRGVDFINGRISVPKYALIYDNRLLEHDGPPITIHDALGDRFSYEELMGA